MSVNTQRCVISGRSMGSLEQFYDELARKLHLPSHFGRNLDALWDALSADVPGPIEVVWEDADVSRRAMGEDFERVTAVLRDVAASRPDFRVVLR